MGTVGAGRQEEIDRSREGTGWGGVRYMEGPGGKHSLFFSEWKVCVCVGGGGGGGGTWR